MFFSSFKQFAHLGKIALDVTSYIVLSNNVINASAVPGSLVGVLSVIGGSGTYTYTLTSNPGGYFAISGSNLNPALTVTAGTYPITIQANNGAGSIITMPFIVYVTPSGYVPTYELFGF